MLTIFDSTAIEQALNGFRPDLITQLTAESHVDRPIDFHTEFINTNVVGTYILLEAVRKYWQRLDDSKKSYL